MSKRLLVAFLGILMLIPVGLAAQMRQISGTVTYASDGTPIIGATVMTRESKRGTVTDLNGKFTLTLSPVDKTLDLSFIGMQSANVSITPNKTVYDVKLEEAYNDLDAVVIVGYGSMPKSDIAGAITSLSAKDIEQNSGADLNTALQGKIPGMQIITTSGEPGAGANISIRGPSSISGSGEPLYVIDGVQIDAGNVTSIDGDATFSPISGIDPNDIESIEVLKDAASASIYGSRAANGVVIITTKGGQELKAKPARVTVSHTSSIVSNSRNLDVLNATEFREIYAESRINNGSTYNSDWVENPYSPYFYRSTDWQDLMFRTVYQTVNNVNVSGGSKEFAYSLSLGYRDLKPTVIYTDYKQYNIRGNFTYKMNDFLTGSTRISYAQQDYRRVLSGTGNVSSVVQNIVQANPCYYPYDHETGELTDYLGGTITRNPIALAKKVPNQFKRTWITLTQNFDIQFHKNLVLKLSGTIDQNEELQKMFTPRIFDASYDINKLLHSDLDRTNYSTDNYLTYKKKWGKHNFSGMAGTSLSSSNSERIRLNALRFLDDESAYIQNATTKNPTHTISGRREMSFYGRLNYSYAGRYIFAATIRRDGSSRFGPDRRFGNFPSLQGAWRISDESFMKWAKPVMHDLKFRVSWGRTGNQTIGNYAWRGLYSAATTSYAGSIAMIYNDPTNYDLGWETTTSTNFGMDLSLVKGRIVLTVDYYVKKSEDLLFAFPISYYSGFSSVSRNYGDIENKGWEFLLETVNMTGPFRWNTSFNISMNRNKILSLPRGESFAPSGFSLAQEGSPVGLFYAHKALGIYARDADNIYRYDQNGNVIPYKKGTSAEMGDGSNIFRGGDVIWYDADGNGVIDDSDRVVVGDPNPDFIGGMQNVFSYKNVTLSVLLQWQYGNDVMNEFRRKRDQMYYTRNTGRDVLRRWQKEWDVTDRPMMRYSDPMENFRESSMWVEDGSFLRLKDVTLSYTIRPKKLINSVKFSFTMINLLTWSKYSGYDPEVNTGTNPFVQGVDNGAYPKARSFNFGVNLSF